MVIMHHAFVAMVAVTISLNQNCNCYPVMNRLAYLQAKRALFSDAKPNWCQEWCVVAYGAFCFIFPLLLLYVRSAVYAYLFIMSNTDSLPLPQYMICGQNDDESNLHVLTERGRNTFSLACEARGELHMKQLVTESTDTVRVHNSCRKSFTDVRKLKRTKVDDTEDIARSLRSDSKTFQWKEACFFLW